MPHACLPMCASPCVPPHACLPMRASPCVPPHACLPMRASPCVPPHACLPMRASPCVPPHACLPMRASPCIPPPPQVQRMIAKAESSYRARRAAQLPEGLLDGGGREGSREVPVPLPLIRIRVDYSGFSTINSQRFGQQFVGKVANPHDMLMFFKAPTRKPSTTVVEVGEERVVQPDELNQSNIEQLLRDSNVVLSLGGLAEALHGFVGRDEKHAFSSFLSSSLSDTQSALSDTQVSQPSPTPRSVSPLRHPGQSALSDTQSALSDTQVSQPSPTPRSVSPLRHPGQSALSDTQAWLVKEQEGAGLRDDEDILRLVEQCVLQAMEKRGGAAAPGDGAGDAGAAQPMPDHVSLPLLTHVRPCLCCRVCRPAAAATPAGGRAAASVGSTKVAMEEEEIEDDDLPAQNGQGMMAAPRGAGGMASARGVDDEDVEEVGLGSRASAARAASQRRSATAASPMSQREGRGRGRGRGAAAAAAGGVGRGRGRGRAVVGGWSSLGVSGVGTAGVSMQSDGEESDEEEHVRRGGIEEEDDEEEEEEEDEEDEEEQRARAKRARRGVGGVTGGFSFTPSQVSVEDAPSAWQQVWKSKAVKPI
ncbi:unnamed protein product [Closterium sp. NIES-65]|nr:unnamed protein product [Closterium sp. NIES-65]